MMMEKNGRRGRTTTYSTESVDANEKRQGQEILYSQLRRSVPGEPPRQVHNAA